MNPQTYNLLAKPTNTTYPDAKHLAIVKVDWNKWNAGALGLIQATTSPVIGQEYLSDSEAHTLGTKLEARFRKVGGAVTYLQLVNMVNIRFTDSTDLLPWIQEFQDGYSWVTLNGHSKLSEDLAMFMFCSHLHDSYEATAQQYLDNITDIANYKPLDIITWVLQEESRRKDHSIKSGSSLNKFSMVKNLGQKKPQHTKSLARRKNSEQGQGESSPKSVKFLRGQK